MPSHLTGRRLLLAFVGLMLGNTMSGIDATIVATAAPTITAEFGRLSLLPWLATAYLLMQIATMPLYGKLGDLFGRKRLFLFAILVFLVASALAGAAQSMPQLIAFRALQGAGAGGLTSLTMALVAEIAPPERLGRYLGGAGLVFAVTSVIGPLAGGLFVDHLSWRWAFYVNLPAGALSILAVVALIPAVRPGVRHEVDVGGAVLLTGTTTSVVLLASWGGVEHAWGSPTIVGLALASVALGSAFVARQRRVPEPIVPLHLFRDRAVRVAVVANMIAGISFFGAVVYLPVFFQAVGDRGATASGALLVPFAVSTALTTVAVGEIVDRRGGVKPFPVAGMALGALGFLMLARVDAGSSVVAVAATAMLVGVGIGCVMQVLLLVVQRATPARDLGVATSATVMARILGGALGVAVLGTVFNNRLVHEIARRVPTGAVRVADLRGDARSVRALDPAVRDPVLDAFAAALGSTFRAAVPIMLLGVVVALALPSMRRVPAVAGRAEAIRSPDGRRRGTHRTVPRLREPRDRSS